MEQEAMSVETAAIVAGFAVRIARSTLSYVHAPGVELDAHAETIAAKAAKDAAQLTFQRFSGEIDREHYAREMLHVRAQIDAAGHIYSELLGRGLRHALTNIADEILGAITK
jgi:hypothetical protein